MATKRPERRKSSLAGESPVTSRPMPPSNPVEPPAQQSPATQSAQAKSAKNERRKMNYYADSDQDGRIRAAYYAGRDERGWRNLSDMHAEIIMAEVEKLESRYNNGEHFDPMPPGTGPVGRPLT